MATNTAFDNFLEAFRSAKQRKREWEQRMDKKLATLEAEMNIRRTSSI